jgi:hypothetical protein
MQGLALANRMVNIRTKLAMMGKHRRRKRNTKKKNKATAPLPLKKSHWELRTTRHNSLYGSCDITK